MDVVVLHLIQLNNMIFHRNNIDNVFLSIIAFKDNTNNTFYISFSNKYYDGKNCSINMNKKLIPQFNNIYENIKKQILFKDLRGYTINNLNYVIGNLKLSTMIYDSKKQNGYIINIHDIESILPFENNIKMLQNRSLFIEEYKTDKCFIIKKINDKDEYFLNFNGLQDFLLSIKKEFLISEILIKDIRKFYKDVMSAFINILEERYNYFN